MKNWRKIGLITSLALLSACGAAVLGNFSFIAPISGAFQPSDNDKTTNMGSIDDFASLVFGSSSSPIDPISLSSNKTGGFTANNLIIKLNDCPNNFLEGYIEIEGLGFIGYTDNTKNKRCFTGVFEGIHKITINPTTGSAFSLCVKNRLTPPLVQITCI